jgi:hypothetical protein
MDPEFIERLQSMRDDLGAVITIRSGIRCPEHNAKVGGASDSEHLPDPVTGLTNGADLGYVGSQDRQLIILTSHLNFRRVGIAENFIHVGNRASKSQDVTWVYPPKKKGTP